MKAVVDQNTCIGCGLCWGMCDAVFRMNDDGRAEAYQAATPEKEDEVQSAIDSCPVSAFPVVAGEARTQWNSDQGDFFRCSSWLIK